ncbi:carboxyl-terminal-processing peptidase 2, chloroplastic [Selaginella moellendorffii]|nr:carboxyl-terminal-processing peptidase 2, chloroplastic [Selaginella moellendorffii]|eukprot:XP_002985444.2 carboxyl-terminal-processing peptidase 2, chloroplastic [Selaginella moellendorffii]
MATGIWQAPSAGPGARLQICKGAIFARGQKISLRNRERLRIIKVFSEEAASRACVWGRKLLSFEIVTYHIDRLRRRQWLLFLVTSALSIALIASAPNNLSAWALTEENLLFLEAWRTIDRAYVDKSFNGQSWFRYRENVLRNEPMNTREETYGAIRKMLATLDDPFTRFLEPEKFKSLVSGTTGALTGVGLEVGFDANSSGLPDELVVVTPVAGGPAARAGIQPGDVILEIDGEKVGGLSLYDAAKKLQGPENSSVILTVLNRESRMENTMTLTREKIVVNPVTWKLCEVSSYQKLGYIRLSTFNKNSVRAVQQALEALHKSGASGYVLDIRNNGGGYFPAVIDIAKMWLDKGVIVYIADNRGIRDIYEADGGSAIAPSEPLALLVNKGTASASEILAGAFKDNDRATVLGEPTFGKGKIQSVFELSDGSGLVVTTARYQTPDKIDIDKVGVSPDRPLPEAIPRDGESFCKCLQGSGSQECRIPLSSLFKK